MRLRGKVAIVTGASHGIGEATAKLFASEGAKVLLADLDETAGFRVVNQIIAKGGKAEFKKTDVTSSSDIQNMVAFAVKKWKKLDILLNNAGIELSRYFPEVTDDEWDKLMDTNLRGVFLGAKSAFMQMLRQRSGGTIINMSSAQGLVSMPGQSVYSASKSGVIGITRGIAIDGGPHNIRANCICPGFIITRMTSATSERQKRRIAKVHPLMRVGLAREVAQAALFLASDESSFVTGCVMTVDGGLTAASPEIALSRIQG
jgi:dihydroanticapsin dehydrogenase